MARKKKYQRIDPIDATLDIEEMTFMGEGLARWNGDAVFVAGTIPGERVDATIWRKHERFFEADLNEVIVPSPHRVTPPCPYVGACTGCQWQHIEYSHQLEIKTKLVADQMRRVGGFDDPPVAPAIGCDDPWGYRNHARFTVGPSGQLGFVNRTRRRFVRIDRCLIMNDGINETLTQLQDKCHETTQVSVRYGPESHQRLVQPTFKSPKVAMETGQTHYTEELLGRRFRIASPSFFQVNIRQAERLVELVRERLELSGSETLVDAYAGVGTFAVLLAADAKQVFAIEESASAIEDARVNIEGLSNVTLIEARTEQALAQLPERPDAVILDPPRVGCHVEALDALIALGARRVVYVSCDPASLAHDLKHLCAEAYALEEIQPIDMFPHTHHIECVATLRKR
ncbi:MAG: 23S rRNA (uracil(1939)-C(5))-methyltransferase RlmD [Chloroflexi bacterium]|nr:23S rRNA (uracil(1939)-C(5))-methyltransferase RlmD [Chloroflexota bacterium]MCI0768890.1 23S rRNA (uracil(1939)-C(5))-methyltransferase RlmD [Chloroflexota bacterium]